MIQIGLSALSFSYRCGLWGQATERVVREPLSIEALINLAADAALQSLEFPVALLHDVSEARIAALRERLQSAGLQPILDSEVASVASLQHEIPLAATIGANLLRVLVSPVLEGARANAAVPWAVQREATIAALREVLPLAEHYGVTLAVENHQDATVDDLLEICTVLDSPQIGVTFDVVNTLVVGDEPFAALERLAPYVRNLHLADYMAHASPLGYRLVRCALGEGEISFRRLFERCAELVPQASYQIELVAHSSRHIQLFRDDWWNGYPPRDIRTLLPSLRMLNSGLRPATDDWRTPWERGASESEIAFYEDQQFATSLQYLRQIGALPRQDVSSVGR